MSGRPDPGIPPRQASTQDVAARAGVSTATVSRVLNTPELVSSATAKKVREAIEALGYKPNLFAKGLMTRRSRIVGLLLPSLKDPHYNVIVQAAHDEAIKHGYRVMVGIVDSHDEPKSSLDLLDGVVIWHEAPAPNGTVSEKLGPVSTHDEAERKAVEAVRKLVERLKV